MKKGKRFIGRLLAGVMAVTMVLHVGATNVSGLKDQEAQLQEQQQEAQSQKNSLEAQVKELTASMNETQEKLDAKQAEIEEAEEALVNAKVQENQQYESMKVRIRYMYENGNVSLIQLFVESESIADFFHRTEAISQISQYDRKKLDEYQMTVRSVEEKELSLQADYEKLQEMQASLVAQQEQASALLAEKAAELAKINADLTTLKANIKKAEEAQKALEEAQKNQAASSGSTTSGTASGSAGSTATQTPVVSGSGYFTHPCPGMSYQSSYFGEVRSSIGDYTPHKGNDYAAPAGTPVYAAAAGTVLIAGYSSSAGNWVVISHGNGLVTKYMHMRNTPLVSAGEKVVKGQQIGVVGTTGQSTGNHLHFQVELNGTAVNPNTYM